MCADSDEGSKPTPKFEINEKVLCFHGELIYEGKVLERDFGVVDDHSDEWAYWIHYPGWSKRLQNDHKKYEGSIHQIQSFCYSWDEYVLETRVLKFSDANLEVQRSVKIAYEE